jgi:uncharacterized membrane protein YdjX (TVP38/TMEM64 family)
MSWWRGSSSSRASPIPSSQLTIENLVAQFAPRTEVGMRGVRWLTFAAAVVALTALAALWQFTPVADVITPGRVTHWAREFAGTVWAPLIVLAAYTPAAMVMFPRPLITLFAVVAFGPWLGFGYAMSGILISAFVTYLIGMRMDRGTVRRLAGPKLNRIIAVLRRRGIVALTAARLVLLAPFAIVGVVAGAIRVKLTISCLQPRSECYLARLQPPSSAISSKSRCAIRAR